MTASDREIATTRVLAWPRERVFRAWTDPDHLARWVGAQGLHEQFVMHGPNGADYPNQSVKAVVDPKNLFRLNQNIAPAV